jgi:hypothetical protein
LFPPCAVSSLGGVVEEKTSWELSSLLGSSLCDVLRFNATIPAAIRATQNSVVQMMTISFFLGDALSFSFTQRCSYVVIVKI